jgi:tetratricopeptide (TPR) repeat protein/TolB-like protein
MPNPAAGAPSLPTPKRLSDTETGVDLDVRLPPGTLLSGRYRVLAPLGVGGMGVVYRAHDEELGQDIALKALRPELGRDPLWVERFRRELLLAREVTHKNVVRIHDIGESEGIRFITMHLVDGCSLLDVLTREGALAPPRALHVFRQVAQALQRAHEVGIVHRDLKPANILLAPDETAYLTDFGIARSLDRAGHTQAGVVPGTLDYLSPEQVAGDPADARSDIYALGIVLYEMLTGELPFAQGSRAEVLAQRLAGRPRDLARAGHPAPRHLRRVVRRCLERHPARRYQTVAELLADLDTARASWRDRAPRALPVALCAGAMALGGAYAWVSRAPAEAPPAPWEAAAPPAVAILPLMDQTGDPSLSWASAGLAEMLSAHLAETPELRVVEPSRVLRVARDLRLEPGADDATLQRVAGLLDVRHLVTGSVRRAGHALRADLRIVSTDAAGSPGKTRAVSAEAAGADGLFGMTGDLGERLRGELGRPRATHEPTPGPQTISLEAARAYRDGRERLLVGDAVGAAPAFERAVAADPAFAAAWEAASEAYQALGYGDKAREAAERAAQAVGARESRLAWRVRARLALLRGELEQAEAAFAELVRRYPNDVQAWLDLAAAQASQGAVAKAVGTLRRATHLDPADPRAWLLLGRNMILAGEARAAVTDPLVRALALMTQAGNDQGRGDVLNAMGVGHQRLGEYPQAIARYGEAAEIRARIGDERGLAVSRKNRASIQLAMGRLEEARPDLFAARAAYERIGDRKGLADVWNDLGALHEAGGDYARARSAYREALRIRQELGDDQKLAQSYDNVGYVFFLEGEYDHALVYWRQALDLHRHTGDKAGVVLSTQNMGFLQTARGRWPEAMKSFLSALQGAREIGFKNAEAVSHANIGLLQQYAGRYAAALTAYDEAVGILQGLGDRRGVTEYTLTAAAALVEIGQLGPAREKLDQAAAGLRESANQERSADFQVALAEWHLARGEAKAARRALGLAAELAQKSRSRAASLRARIVQGSALLAAGEKDPALRHLQALWPEAQALGHALLRLRAAQALAEAELATGQAEQAEARARDVLADARRHGWAAGTWRAQALLGAARERRGDVAGAAAAYRAGARDLARARDALPPGARREFDATPVVRLVDSRASSLPR